ncbi:beta-ketoacyl-[acyl-carrier-protein] synthase family protein [Nocardioides halotolerans]|uniref:beta-ketoacyl-[acyl-carrier-protein] synthase family protein n=1 Tax=Nocardioides halotolerans TaxID=433660 RepID=UPI00040A7533|nr:beta-ketoacyl-[acyl-carrier-protein] synthase family protein [Nocardioides halotolerans]
MTDRTVVVTALGVLSPLGRGPEATYDAALAGRSGITRQPDGGLAARVCGPDEPAPVRDSDGRPLRGRATALAVTAGRDALRDVEPGSVDLVVGTTMGEPSWIDTWPDHEAAQVPVPAARARELLAGTPEALAASVASELGVGGRVAAVGGACAAGNFALARALDVVRSGRSPRVLAGGVDAFSRTALTGFARLGALAADGCRPFGLDRQGLVLGEGAAFLLVESLASARARGAEPLAELAGAGLSCDAHHPTSPHPEGAGAARAVRAALADAGLAPDDVGWVSAHGTGTPANDRAEVLALRAVFTGHQPPASSVKSLSGHGLGAASAIEAVLAVQALRSGCLPPTWHVGEQDPDCAWDVLTDGPRPLTRDVVLNQAYAFGGCNAVTVLRRAS